MGDLGGRPTKLDDEMQEKLVQAIRAGNYMETAAAFAGISKDTLYRWLRRGARERKRLEDDEDAILNPEEAPFVRFSYSIEKAQAESEVRDVSLIGKHAEYTWQAAAWRLERKFPARWGRKPMGNTDGEGTQIINILPLKKPDSDED